MCLRDLDGDHIRAQQGGERIGMRIPRLAVPTTTMWVPANLAASASISIC